MTHATDQRIRERAGTRPLDSVVYQQAVDRLRARGCRCPLRFDGMTAVPVTPGDAAACVAVHRDMTDVTEVVASRVRHDRAHQPD